MKRLTSMMLCSTLLLGLISNSSVLNSYAEEDQSITAYQSDKEVEIAENLVEQEPTIETTSDEITDSEAVINPEEKTDNDVFQVENEPGEKLSDPKAVLATIQPQATTKEGQPFDLADIEYTIDGSTIILTAYTGNKTDLVIPSKLLVNNQEFSVKVKINKGTDGSAKRLFPNSVESIKFVAINGEKVGLESDTNYSLDYLFSITGNTYSSLTSIDFSGLDMDPITSMYATFYGPFVPNLQTINFGDNTLPNVTNMGNTFNQLSNLESVQQNWKFGKLENMSQMFGTNKGQTKLTTIGDTSNWDTSTVTNMSQVFLNCSKLTNLNLTNWDVSSVTTMSQMFFNCQSLVSIGDTKDWIVLNVNNFSDMFYNCISLNEIRMDNWELNDTANLGNVDDENTMFYLYDISKPLPALIIASDSKLLSLDYAYSGYIPSCEIRINANQGKLAKNEYQQYGEYPTGLSYYFDKVVIPTQEYNELQHADSLTIQNKISTWLKDNIPTRLGYSLTDWAPTDPLFNQLINEITNFNTFISSKAEFKAEWVIDKFDTSVDNTKLTPSGSFGIAYYPTAFNMNSTDLHSSGKQEIPITKTTSFNIGVKDRTRIKNEWHVTAQLIWTGASIPEAYIQTTNNGTVMKNVSTGSGTYNPATDLKTLQESGITGTANAKITTTPNTIMESTDVGSAVNNGVYDYDLGEAKLVIPDVSQVRAGTYSGQVEWNLVNGPA